MEKIKFIADSACDMDINVAKEYGVEVLPLPLTVDDKTYRDQLDFTPAEFFEILNDSKRKVFTAGLSPAILLEAFNRAYDDGYRNIIYTSINAKGSNTYQSAQMAKEMFFEGPREKTRIELIDSQCYCHLISVGIIKMVRMSRNDADVDALLEFAADYFPRVESYVSIYTLDTLRRTGRISSFSGAVGGLLDIKPFIHVGSGSIDASERIRGKKNVIPHLVETIKKRMDPDCDYIGVIYADMDEEGKLLREAVEKEFPGKEIYEGRIGSVICVHVGSKSLGLFFLKKKDL